MGAGCVAWQPPLLRSGPRSAGRNGPAPTRLPAAFKEAVSLLNRAEIILCPANTGAYLLTDASETRNDAGTDRKLKTQPTNY